jgi:hypothetical protein
MSLTKAKMGSLADKLYSREVVEKLSDKPKKKKKKREASKKVVKKVTSKRKKK